MYNLTKYEQRILFTIFYNKNIELYNIICYSFIKDNQFNCKYIIIIM